MSDIFDDALKITEESVAAQVEAGAIDTVYQENRALERDLKDSSAEIVMCHVEIEQLRAENERLKAFIADKIHDATRERMLMEIDYKGVGCE